MCGSWSGPYNKVKSLSASGCEAHCEAAIEAGPGAHGCCAFFDKDYGLSRYTVCTYYPGSNPVYCTGGCGYSDSHPDKHYASSCTADPTPAPTPSPTPAPTPAPAQPTSIGPGISPLVWLLIVVLSPFILDCCVKAAKAFRDAIKSQPPPMSTPLLRVDSAPLLSQPQPPGPLAVLPPPRYWENQELAVSFDERYDGGETHDLVEEMLRSTFLRRRTRDRDSDMPQSLRLLKLQRVEDSKLWIRYQAAKERVRRKRGGQCTPLRRLSRGGDVKTTAIDNRIDPNLNEFYLWHGSTPEGVHGISEDGFKINLAGSHAGTMFGPGAYLAECCSKSDEYAHEGEGIYKDIYGLILCRAVCGEMYYTEQAGQFTSVIESGQYDSVLGDREAARGTYREFVLFDKDLIYPEFVVLYTRTY